MITEINYSKNLSNHISCIFKCKFEGKNVIHVNGRITINVNLSVKNVIYVKKIKFRILLHVAAKMENI